MTDIMNRVEDELIGELHWQLEQFSATGRWGLTSPIEQAFAAMFVMRARLLGAQVASTREVVREVPNAYFLEPQVSIGSYRVDFLLGVGEFADDLQKSIVIECEGHEWHERTREQAAADKARDRYLSGHVARVIHFTGSEIYMSPARCAVDALRILNVVLGEGGGGNGTN